MSAPASGPAHVRVRCVELARAHDWAGGPLGPVAGWPPELRQVVRAVLDAAVPTAVWWGPDRVQVYNDAYARILGARHPAAFARPARAAWVEAWPQLGPLADEAAQHGQAVHRTDLRVLVQRSGRSEAGWLTLAVSPVRVRGEAVGGVLVVATDTTSRVLTERRLRLLSELGAVPLRPGDGPEDVLARVGDVLGRHREVAPAVAAYLRAGDPAALHLALATGAARAGHRRSGLLPATVPATGRTPVGRVAAGGRPEVLRGLRARYPGALEPAPDVELSPDQALLLPLRATPDGDVGCVLVLFLDPHGALDADQRVFGAHLARAVAAGLSGADALADERRRREHAEAQAAEVTGRVQAAGHRMRASLAFVLAPLQQLLTLDPPADEPYRDLLATAHRAARALSAVVDEVAPAPAAADRPGTPTRAPGGPTAPGTGVPAMGPPGSAATGTAATGSGEPAAAGRPPGRVLVVAADDDLREVLVHLVTADGWEVTAAADVPAALRTAGEPDLVIGSGGHDGTDGLALVQALRSVPTTAHTPVVLLAARVDSAAVVAGLRAGADDYVVGPFAPDELLARVRAHVARHHRERAERRAAEDEIASLRVALATNRRIGNAMGVVMAALHISADDAFERLRLQSQRTNRKLADLADEIVATGAVPELPAPRRPRPG